MEKVTAINKYSYQKSNVNRYSGVSNCHHVTAIYFGKMCTPLRSYWIPLHLLDLRYFWDFLGNFEKFCSNSYNTSQTKVAKSDKKSIHSLFAVINSLLHILQGKICLPLRLLYAVTAIYFGNFCQPLRLFNHDGN